MSVRISKAEAQRLGITPSKPQQRRGMNGLERRFEAEHIKYLRTVGVVKWYAYESIKLRLADRTWFTPDFMCVTYENNIVFYEVKGFWRDDARVKIKVAAEQYPQFAFRSATYSDGHWQFETF